MKIYVVGEANHYARWIDKNVELAKDIQSADLVLFTGGSDVHPFIYGNEINPKTFYDRRRDDEEYIMYAECLGSKKPCLGICRGAQALTAFQKNGRLIQDVENHATGYMHEMEFEDGSVLPITSTHHQMMYPFDIDNYELIAWSKNRLSYRYEFGPGETYLEIPMNKEPEIAFYPDTKCLAIQGHPEMMDANSETVIKLRQLIKDKLFL